MSKVFISYNHKDSHFAKRLQAVLQQEGINVGTDEPDVTENITKAIVEKIKAASAVVVLVSEKTLQSKWVLFEVGVAQGFNKEVIFILLPGVEGENPLPDILVDPQILDGRKLTMTQVTEELEKLLSQEQS